MENELIIVIPSYEPDEELIKLVDKLNDYFNKFKLIVINDGSIGFEHIFDKVKDKPNVILLNHEVNMGKGKALKTAFTYIKEQGLHGTVVTADSDGQHKPEDIKRVYDFALKNKKSLILGSRKFDVKMPLRSTFGNDMSRGMLRLCLNKHLCDTQTGLRAFSTDFIPFMLEVKGNRYEYEMNMLSEAIRGNDDIKEISIQTIYINNNKGSHFRPVRDFSCISIQILKYLLVNLHTVLINFFACLILASIFKDKLANNGWFYISMVSFLISLSFNLLFNKTGFLFGNKRIFRNKKGTYRYLISILLAFIADISFTSLFYLWTAKIVLAKFLSILVISIVHLVGNYFLLRKSKLYEE